MADPLPPPAAPGAPHSSLCWMGEAIVERFGVRGSGSVARGPAAQGRAGAWREARTAAGTRFRTPGLDESRAAALARRVRSAAELAEAAAESGVGRVCPLGTTAWPPPDWRHDGRHQLLPVLRWTDWELS